VPETQGVGQLRRPELGRARPRLVDQPFESIGVHGVGRDGEQITPADGLQERRRLAPAATWLELLPQPRHQALDDRSRRRRGVLSPQLVDEPVGRHGFAGVEDQQREESAPAPGGEGDTPGPFEDLHSTQDPELHPCLHDGVATVARGLHRAGSCR